jgi:hypothetical protein
MLAREFYLTQATGCCHRRKQGPSVKRCETTSMMYTRTILLCFVAAATTVDSFSVGSAGSRIGLQTGISARSAASAKWTCRGGSRRPSLVQFPFLASRPEPPRRARHFESSRPAHLLPQGQRHDDPVRTGHRWKASPPAHAHTSHRVGEGPTLGETRTLRRGRGRLPVSVGRGGVPAGSVFKTPITKESLVDRAEILYLLHVLIAVPWFPAVGKADPCRPPETAVTFSPHRCARCGPLPCFFRLCNRGERRWYDRQRRDI